MQPTKEIGLRIYGNQELQKEYTSEYGNEFTAACLDLAITVVSPKTPNRKTPTARSTKNGHFYSKFNPKTKKYRSH